MSDDRKTADPQRLYTFDEVREAWGRGRNQVYDDFRAGRVPGGVRIGGRWYAIKREFDRAFPRGEAA